MNVKRNRFNQFTKEDEAVDTSNGTQDHNKIEGHVMKRKCENIDKRTLVPNACQIRDNVTI